MAREAGPTVALGVSVQEISSASTSSVVRSVDRGEADPSAALRDDNKEASAAMFGGSAVIFRTRAHWTGARTVNLIPSCAMRSSTLRLTAVSASHMPSGLR